MNERDAKAEVTTMQTQAEARQAAEQEIFALRKQIDLYTQAGDMDEISRLQLEISQLQQKFGAVKGVGKDEYDGRAV